MNKLLFLLLLFTVYSFGQQQPIPSGGDAVSSGGSVSYSIGQFAYQSASGSNGSINEGVQQPFEVSATLGMENTNIQLEMQVYPNPVSDFLILKIQKYAAKNMKYRLFDFSGKLIAESSIKNLETPINFQNYAKSGYVLQVTENGKILKIFKIVKK